MVKWIFWLILITFLMLASFATTLPLIIVLILLMYLFYRDFSVLFLAFIFGLFLDIQGAGHIGVSSIFLLLFIFIVSLYERKYEIATLPFVFFVSFIGSFLFLEISGDSDYLLIESLANSIIASAIFVLGLHLRESLEPDL